MEAKLILDNGYLKREDEKPIFEGFDKNGVVDISKMYVRMTMTLEQNDKFVLGDNKIDFPIIRKKLKSKLRRGRGSINKCNTCDDIAKNNLSNGYCSNCEKYIIKNEMK